MSEHVYQKGSVSEQQFAEDVSIGHDEIAPDESASEKGRSRVGPAILDVLHHSPKALTPQQVHDKLPELSEQQINAAIQNLYKKGAGRLERVKAGRSFAYSIKPEKVRQKRKGKQPAQAEILQGALPVDVDVAAAQAPVHETGTLEAGQSQRQSQVQVQERQPLNVTVSLDGQFIISKDGQMIRLDKEEREQFFNFVRHFLS